MEEIQSSKNKGEAVCWSHLGKIYKQESLPFSKLKVGDVVITDKKDISNELYEHYMEQFQPPSLDLTNINDMEIMKEFKEILKGLSTSTDEVEVTNTSEIKNAIRSIRPKKSAEFDNISNFIIKRLPPGHIQGLGNCFNLWLEECRMPNEWKLAKIITLNKLKGGVSKCDQTCPISLLAAHSKLYEKILLTRIRSWAESNHIIPKEQSGFRPNCLIPTRVLSVYQEVLNNMAANSPTLSIYFDYQKACDKVWHAALIVKFSRVNIPFTLLKTIWFWLSMREAVVVYGELSTRKFTISIGLPQGSCLSSYLFIVFHSDIVKQTGAFSTHIFSDDLNVLISAPLEKKLEPMLQFLELEGTKKIFFSFLTYFYQAYSAEKQKLYNLTMSSTVNQMDQERKRSQAPATVKRVDGASTNIGDSQDHVHFTDGSALKRDGTWKHGPERNLSREERKWLIDKHGWTSPAKK
ncbi:unnamed protein product [Rotaria magnacalcarata]|uniref:Reverse transcriptase domain-containing protein n=3 Tax=Rotaria magnacalcarata TaxID=392030 RepID=A0A816L624_9BILA|nr:unnamed protein product [Rotaria magnacalcarata]